MDFSNKVVLITGASSGIGAETAKYMARRDALLSLSGKSKSALDLVALECKKLSREEVYLSIGDLTDEEYIRSLIVSTIDKFGKLDVLVNGVGVFQYGSVEGQELMKQFDSAFAINVRPLISLIAYAVPHLERTKGNIVNVSNVAGTVSLPGMLAYSMTKAAINQLTSITSLELGPKRIRVNAVGPGVMDSPIYDETDASRNSYFQRVKEWHPLGRIGLYQEVASVIGFLASEEASFINGSMLLVDGGRHCAFGNTPLS